MKKERQSNFELLRIVSMFLIILYHSFICTFGKTPVYNSISMFSYYIISIWGILGVCCFVYITGWFSIKKNYTFSFTKVIKLILETIFYGLILLLIYYKLGYAEINFQNISDSIFFFFTKHYWFITAYILLLFLIPILNKIIFSMKLSDYRKLVIILTIMIPLYRTFYTDALSNAAISNVFWISYLYLLIGYLKLRPNNFFERNAKKGLIMTATFSVCVAFFLPFVEQNTDIMWFDNHSALVSNFNSIFMIIVGLFLFYTFKNINIKPNKIINLFGKTTLGIYLLHYNFFGNEVLFPEIFKIKMYSHSKRLVFWAIGSCLIVYFICTIIDMIRIYLLEKPIVDRILKKCNFSKIDNFINLKD